MVQRHRLRRRVAPGTVEAVSRPVAHALTRLSTGPNPRIDRAVARCVPSAGPSRRYGRLSGVATPRVARSGAPHGKRAVDAAEAPHLAAVTKPAPPESARAPVSGHRPAAAAGHIQTDLTWSQPDDGRSHPHDSRTLSGHVSAPNFSGRLLPTEITSMASSGFIVIMFFALIVGSSLSQSPSVSPTLSPMASPTVTPVASPMISPTSTPIEAPLASPPAPPASLAPGGSPASSPSISSSPNGSPTTSPPSSATFNRFAYGSVVVAVFAAALVL
ncbi:hypothetical protein E3N88_07311 [Mikania micrantha]|uniref:Uncharacterized protein n=1 Tax=Mikania micrantha TaxID=192012 RepID=A0A5N6PTB9_9ASTR|nr:hypothetical protein E3N88_07311 [Mikania micrantha]